MEFEQTGEFEKDVKRLDKTTKERLKEIIRKIAENPEIGKPLGHLKLMFSIRITNHRLIYRYAQEKILLICFKSRDGVYDYLRERL